MRPLSIPAKEKKAHPLAYTIVVLLVILLVVVIVRKKNETLPDTKTYYNFTTTHGKKILIESKKDSTTDENITTLTVGGYKDDKPIIFKKGPLSYVYLTDLNLDSYEELVLIFTKEGQTKNQAVVFTSYGDEKMTEIKIPDVTEEDKTFGGIFEGYVGNDIFAIERNTLLRSFLKKELLAEDETLNETGAVNGTTTEQTSGEENSSSTDTANTTNKEEKAGQPTTKRKQIMYELKDDDGFYFEPKEIEVPKELVASSTASISASPWVWISTNAANKVSVRKNNDTIFSFADDFTLNVSSPCESFSGSYVLSGRILRIGSFEVATSTQDTTDEEIKTCLENNKQTRDALLLSESFIIRDTQLAINLEKNKGVVLFELKQ